MHFSDESKGRFVGMLSPVREGEAKKQCAFPRRPTPIMAPFEESTDEGSIASDSECSHSASSQCNSVKLPSSQGSTKGSRSTSPDNSPMDNYDETQLAEEVTSIGSVDVCHQRVGGRRKR